ncbi:ATP-binding protein [Streptomyces sp. AJS327]|uniref:tetratricopeptide repeat protein n=1 Tax=Streptomyces sp. AJS327 TaxID=2545265 RepID=UPI0015DD745B|nr:tetratricopeptide repeat protein [Streptomyces sp. AJS327]MBA0053678.1 ATP-binding protein [Streptomyces sp. AJS327]
MLDVVTASVLTTFISGVGNGAAGEMGKQLLLSTGALARRTLGREVRIPEDRTGIDLLARELESRLRENPERSDEWSRLVSSHPGAPARLTGGPGLPPATRHFTDRQPVLRSLDREASRAYDGRPRAVLLHGPPGIGTTAVALHWGATRAGRYRDGQYYVDLREPGGTSTPDPATVLLRLLHRMGVASDRVPPTEAGRVDRYRELTAGRQLLVVVDHVSSLAQVRQLVPASSGVFLLVVASGPPFMLEAERVPVPPLSRSDSRRMLRAVAGRENVARARPPVSEVLAECAGNAFALRAAAERLLSGRPEVSDTVDTPSGTDPVWDAARAACRRVSRETSRLCRLTALGGWPSVDARLAAAAADVPADEAARMLAEAADVGLVEALPDDRYLMRPGVSRYLAHLAGPEHGVPECFAAVSRTLHALRDGALHAARAALPQSWRTDLAPADGTPPATEAAGLALLRAEVGNLTRAVTVAEEYQHHDIALLLARALWPLQLKAGYWDEVLPALRTAVQLADAHRADSRMAGALHFQLGHCLDALGQREEADQQVRAAIDSERAAQHLRGVASAVELLGLTLLYQLRWESAHELFVEAERVYREITAGEEGAADLPRALTLVKRHRARALRGMDRLAESRQLLAEVVDFFAEHGEDYNRARALTDLAEAHCDAGQYAAALERIDEAERLLDPAATPHLDYLSGLRDRCVPAR